MMNSVCRYFLIFLVLEHLPGLATGLDAVEGETLTLTCPRPSRSLPVVWQGPPHHTHYTEALDVNLELSADQRSRLSLKGNHDHGYYNLQIESLKKSDSGTYRCLIGSRVIRKIRLNVRTQEEENQGLFPYILNLATRSRITTNATCGEDGAEYFCKLVDNVDLMPQISHCAYCNAQAGRPGELGEDYPITNAIDGSNRWWQSPSIQNGREYNYVTITLDLGLIYQVAYVVIKAANAPRPGHWTLEKSIDGVNYEPWQYFAINDDDCEKLYNVRSTPGKPKYDYLRDDEVRCTSYFSKLNPVENGEIFVSLTNGRPGIYVPSKTLLDFTSARYVRLRLGKIRTLNADLMSLQSSDPRNIDPSVTRRYFYSIKDISIGGQCICYGHALECQRQGDSDSLACKCQHNTCGTNCEYCCPLFNNKAWQRGGGDGNGRVAHDVSCEECNCHNHADECVYNATVAALGLSQNINGEVQGGGVCLQCKEFTTGINCEQCLPGYYRPYGVSHNSPRPCRECTCVGSVGSTGICVTDDSKVNEGLVPGDCVCNQGYRGSSCDQCDLGFHGYPNCEPCTCNLAGTVDPNNCEGRCDCKDNVDGINCDMCKPGHYDLTIGNEMGCRRCFCFGITSVCQSAGLGLVQVTDMSSDMDGWTVITLNDDAFILFAEAGDGWLQYRTFPAREQNSVDTDRSLSNQVIYYWQAPIKYYGSRLTAYSGKLHYTMKFTIDGSAPWQHHLAAADVILQGNNMTVTTGRNYVRENQENVASVDLVETAWYRLDATGQHISRDHVTRREFMELLYDLRRILIRATHHTAQDLVLLKDVLLDTVSAGSTSEVTLSGVEKCACPRGYTGLSCESCEIGWRRVDNIIYGGTCVPCDCYGHSKTCDPFTGRCLMCTDNTEGNHCDTCAAGFHGDPTRGTPDDCQPCACPLEVPSNNFATRCVHTPTFNEPDGFTCLDCALGYAGERCERCDHGYYGYPGILGNYCQPCDCSGNIDQELEGSCDQLTGQCNVCIYNTEGKNCGTCMAGYYGTAVNGDCKTCDCDAFGSDDMTCDTTTGQCRCKEHYTGRSCDRCETGYGDVTRGCAVCNCSRIGSLDYRCHPITGQCVCRPGVTGLPCDQCREGYYGYSRGGCYDCRCYRPGANKTEICHSRTGQCNCLPFVRGERCDGCEENYWGLELGTGCVSCDCHVGGSYFEQCNSLTGQCHCKTGVSGLRCDECFDGYYGLMSLGECKECLPCTKPGHICHPDTGECVCPPNTMGETCEMCVDMYWGYDPRYGCKSCDCDAEGSLDNNCDPLSGQCPCNVDYSGKRCDSCLFGFYNFPDCSLCLCSVEGTEPTSCDQNGACRCNNNNGQCVCKENTVSRTCTQCKEDTFSLDEDNPSGCTECFCFERGGTCRQAPFVWTEIAYPDMAVTFDNMATSMVTRQPNGFYVIPNNVSWTDVPSDLEEEALYWKLPGVSPDQTLSYNGALRFTVKHGTLGNTELSDLEGTDKPLVALIGHGLPIMYRYGGQWEMDKDLSFTVSLHEHFWRTQRNGDVSRKLLMIILQNVTDILIRASWDTSAVTAELSMVTMDTAVDNNVTLGPPALGIEECTCPEKYDGLSCQDPSDGYFRVPSSGPIDFTDLIGVIGDVDLCDCSGHGSMCDRDTGVCLECKHNTGGDHCDECVDGYYGNPIAGTPADCQRCACPLEVDSNNFSPTCEKVDGNLVCTACSLGYTGDRCEFCDIGHYGDPSSPGGSCQSCDCNPEGSWDTSCDLTGQCTCLPGIMGEKCDQCEARHAVVDGACVSCDEGCTRTLMSDLDELTAMTDTLPFDLSNVSVPIGKLNSIRNETVAVNKLLDDLRLAEANVVKDRVTAMSKEVEMLNKRSEDVLEISQQSQRDAGTLLTSAADMESQVNTLQHDMEALIEDLENRLASSFHNRSGINVTAALIEARAILAEIRPRDFKDAENAARTEDKLAEALSDRVRLLTLRLTDTSALEKKIADLNAALSDLLHNQTQTSLQHGEQTMEKVNMLRDILPKLKMHVNETKHMNKAISKNLLAADQLLKDADVALERARENTRTLEREAVTLESVITPLGEKEEALRTSIPGVVPKVEEAVSHANNLSRYAGELEEQFESTRTAAADPLRAAGVYDHIVSAIEEADRAAKKAIMDADNATGIADMDELNESVDVSLQRSIDLLGQANDTLKNGVAGLGNDLGRLNSDLDKILDDQIATIDAHQDLTDSVDELPRDLVDRMAGIKTKIDMSEVDAGRSGERAGQIDGKMDMEMVPKLEELQAIHGDNYEDINISLIGAQTEVTDMKNLTDSLDLRYEQSMKLNTELGNKLKKLKQSIREAREEANKVKTSLMSEGKCVKKFRPVATPGTLNTISFAFKTSDINNDMMIVLVQNNHINEGDTDKEFLAVELRNMKIRFSWNAGGGTASIEHDLTIRSQSAFLRETDKWIKVVAQRIGRLGRLTVHSLGKEATPPQTKTSVIGFSVINFDESTDFFVAGVPEVYDIVPDITLSNFSGCLGSLYVDDQLVGLSNFEKHSSDKCMACLEVPSLAPGANVYTFDGTGYAVTDKARIARPIATNIILDFSTYWENSTLFFVGNSTTGEFMSLQLEHGHVVFQFNLGSGSYARLQSDLKYNRNRWVPVAVGRNRYFGMLEVGSESKLIQAPHGDYLFRAKESDVNFGGIPDDIDIDFYEKQSGHKVITEKFLGCMKGIQIALNSVNLWDGKASVGVSESCRDSGLRSIGFYGRGFAEYAGTSLDTQESDLSLSFSTTAPEGLLVLAKNINGDSFYSLALIDGHVEGRFSGGAQPIILTSTRTYNDGLVHSVAVKKTDRRMELYIDDQEVDNDRMPKRFDLISVREDGGLYVGGVPEGLNVEGLAATDRSVDGCISDIVISGNVLNINKPKQYDKADIGRCRKSSPVNGNSPPPVASDAPAANDLRLSELIPGPVPGPEIVLPTKPLPDEITPEVDMKLKPVPLRPGSCASNTGLYKYEPDAYTFGEESISFQVINVTKKEMERKFSVSLDFRTFYGNGILFYLTNLDHSSFVAVQLKGGAVVITYEHKSRIREIIVQPKYSLLDGDWHNVLVQKNRKRIALLVDGNSKKGGDIVKRLRTDVPLFIGGVPSSFMPLIHDEVVPHSVRGCIRNLVVNEELKNFQDATFISSVDRCFTNIEKGAHFTGNSYGTIAQNLMDGNQLDIWLEFRTPKPEGILITMSGTGGQEAVTLQLHRGQVKLTRKRGGEQITAETTFDTQFHLCDQQWHTIAARMDGSLISLEVDGAAPVTASSWTLGHSDPMMASLYVGGAPEPRSQAAALTTQGFEGCLRNVRINDKVVDWFNLMAAVDIFKTACPLT